MKKGCFFFEKKKKTVMCRIVSLFYSLPTIIIIKSSYMFVFWSALKVTSQEEEDLMLFCYSPELLSPLQFQNYLMRISQDPEYCNCRVEEKRIKTNNTEEFLYEHTQNSVSQKRVFIVF